MDIDKHSRCGLGTVSKVHEQWHTQCMSKLGTFIEFHQHWYKHTCSSATLFLSHVHISLKQSKRVLNCPAILASKLVYRWCWRIPLTTCCVEHSAMIHKVLANVVPAMSGIQKGSLHCAVQCPVCLDGNIEKEQTKSVIMSSYSILASCSVPGCLHKIIQRTCWKYIYIWMVI